MSISYETLLMGITTFILIVITIRTSKIRIKDAIFWIVWTLALAVFAFTSDIQNWVKNLMGLNDPSIFVFFLVVIFSYFVMFRNSIIISQHEDKIKELSQIIAIDQLEQKKKNNDMINMMKKNK